MSWTFCTMRAKLVFVEDEYWVWQPDRILLMCVCELSWILIHLQMKHDCTETERDWKWLRLGVYDHIIASEKKGWRGEVGIGGRGRQKTSTEKTVGSWSLYDKSPVNWSKLRCCPVRIDSNRRDPFQQPLRSSLLDIYAWKARKSLHSICWVNL